jgi:hypothetical protein
METAEIEPQVLANRLGVEFCLVRQNSTIGCVITTEALEAYFWLEPRASDARILKTFREATAASSRWPNGNCSPIPQPASN